MNMETKNWALRLFDKSLLKQQKYQAITAMLGSTESFRCLDLGGDNGIISYLLRQRGGNWSSADLDDATVASIRMLVETEVYQIDGTLQPFADGIFDCVIIIDLLEHVADDRRLIEEMHRILKPGGFVLINVPHWKDDWLRNLRNRLGQTDEQHGHLRPGYTLDTLEALLIDCFEIEAHRTYSGFFSELADTLIVFIMSRLKGGQSKKGLVVTSQDLRKFQSAFRAYSLVYPLFRAATFFDHILPMGSGYKLLVKARARQPVG